MLRDVAPKPRREGVARARRLRREMTLPEVLLWRALRRHSAGLKFRRQHPSGPYVFDFYCGDARLVIEIDGEAHSRGDRPARDEVRDVWLQARGLATLRIAAADVLNGLEHVIRHIDAVARSRLSLHHPAAPGGPPPRDELGED